MPSALAVGGQGGADIQFAVHGADRTGGCGIADQANRLAGDTQADGDFRADRGEIEIFVQGAVAQARFLMPAVVAHLVAQQA